MERVVENILEQAIGHLNYDKYTISFHNSRYDLISTSSDLVPTGDYFEFILQISNIEKLLIFKAKDVKRK